MATKKPESKVSRVRLKRGADSQIVVQQPLEIEDEFKSLYESSKNENVLVQPPYAPLQLAALAVRNNTLKQAVHAMEVNIDGTGHTFELKEGETDDEAQKQLATDFFNEPVPGMSMVTLRRKLRVDLEELGYGYLEVVRNVNRELCFLRYVKASTVRMVKLDTPVDVEKTVQRSGKDFTAKMPVRERRYAQRVGQRLLYFKEYGASRDIDKTTGLWAAGDLPAQKRGSELLRFVVDEDVDTPYGIPRWINNTPSAIGSRKAEEFNLDFFDSGGLPPAIIFIQGGGLSTIVREQLLQHLAGKGSQKHRAAVVEVQSSSGSLDSGGKVDVKTERFGDSRMNDAMFMKYDEACEKHITGAFRLPPIFFGKAGDYNFATAITAYMVTEAQVFQPERHEFDEVINTTVMKELKIDKYKFKSNPITLKNIDAQLQGLVLGQPMMDGEHFIKKLNEVTGLDLEYSADAEMKNLPPPVPEVRVAGGMGMKRQPIRPGQQANASGNVAPNAAVKPAARPGLGTPAKGGVGVRKADFADIVDLSTEWAMVVGLMPSEVEYTPEAKVEVLRKVEELSGPERNAFATVVSMRNFVGAQEDLSVLADCCAHLISHKTH